MPLPPAVFSAKTFVLTSVKNEKRDPPSSSTVPVNWWFRFSSWLLFTTLLIPPSTKEATSLLSCLLSRLSHARLFETPWTVAHQAPLSMRFVQARILQWVTISFSRGSSRPRGGTRVSCTEADSLLTELPGSPLLQGREGLLSSFSAPLSHLANKKYINISTNLQMQKLTHIYRFLAILLFCSCS